MLRAGAAAVAAIVAACAVGLALLVGSVAPPAPASTPSTCRLVSSDGESIDVPVELDPEQLTNASIVVSTAQALGLDERAAVIGVATALQESGLRVLSQEESDRDSAGIFQQRPSQGWGTVEQVMDPVYASRSFFERFVQVPNWQNLPLTVAAQAVQVSAYPDAYAQWEQTASALTMALTGARGGGWPAEQMGPDGLTPRTRYVRDLIASGFGETNMGGWCPGGCTDGHVEGSDHYTGHAIDVMILPYTDPTRIADGDRIATWLTANAQQLAVKYVIWRALIWSPGEGWRPYTHPSGSNLTLIKLVRTPGSVDEREGVA